MRRLLLAALLVTAACSSTTSGQGAASGPAGVTSAAAPVTSQAPSPSAPAALDETKIDPCSLVTKAEADKAAGVTTMAPVRALTLCTFATPTSGAVGQFEVTVGDGAKKFLDIDKDTLKHPFTMVAGVGDEAWLETNSLFFRVRTLWIVFRVTRLDDVNVGPLLESFARQVAGRL